MILYRVIGLNFEFRGQVENEDEVKLALTIFYNCCDAFVNYVIQIITFSLFIFLIIEKFTNLISFFCFAFLSINYSTILMDRRILVTVISMWGALHMNFLRRLPSLSMVKAS